MSNLQFQCAERQPDHCSLNSKYSSERLDSFIFLFVSCCIEISKDKMSLSSHIGVHQTQHNEHAHT